MHYCSAELETSSAPPSPRPTASRPQFSFSPHLKPQTSLHPTPLFSNSRSIFEELEAQKIRQQELEEDLIDSLDELSEGIDVLQILERAYDQTIKTHVAAPSPSPLLNTPLSKHPNDCKQNASLPSQRQSQPSDPIPLMSGSSTALLAVLDHAPQPPSSDSSMTTLSLVSSSACPPLSSSAPATSSPISNYAAGTLHPSIFLDNDQTPSCDAVIRIAHIGDCMGMLVRDEEIIWRSEEMWWDVSMPTSLRFTSV
jgi:hypothetical protein